MPRAVPLGDASPHPAGDRDRADHEHQGGQGDEHQTQESDAPGLGRHDPLGRAQGAFGGYQGGRSALQLDDVPASFLAEVRDLDRPLIGGPAHLGEIRAEAVQLGDERRDERDEVRRRRCGLRSCGVRRGIRLLGGGACGAARPARAACAPTSTGSRTCHTAPCARTSRTPSSWPATRRRRIVSRCVPRMAAASATRTSRVRGRGVVGAASVLSIMPQSVARAASCGVPRGVTVAPRVPWTRSDDTGMQDGPPDAGRAWNTCRYFSAKYTSS